MINRKWTYAAFAAVLMASANVGAQTASKPFMATYAIHANLSAFQDRVDPSKTTVETKKTDGGVRVTETKTEYDKDGKVVRKTTTTTDYSGREYDKKRTVKKKTTEIDDYDTDGEKYKKTKITEEPTSTGSKKTTEEDPAGSKRNRKTEEEEYDKDGKLVKKTTYHKATGNGKASETDFDKDGKPTKKTTWDADGNKESETEYDSEGKPKKETRYNEDGTKTEFEDFDKEGKPRKVTTYHKNGKKKHEGKVDDKGNVTERREYDDRGREIKKTITDGDVEETEYEGTTDKVRRKTVTHPDGSKTVTDYNDNQPKPSRKYDKRGRQISMDSTMGSLPANAIIIAPNEVVAGQSFQFTVATLDGKVVANQPITLDGGSLGQIEATTDLNGVVTAKAPDGWKNFRIVGGAISSALIVKTLLGGGSGSNPKVVTPPSFIQPGGIVNIGTEGMPGMLQGQDLMIGGKKAHILAASGNSIKALVPNGLAMGEHPMELTHNGKTIDRRTVECVNLQWEALRSPMTVGQSAKRTLRITGTSKPVMVMIQDRQGDAVRVNSMGRMRSSGGENNVVEVSFIATAPGTFAIPAEVSNGNTEYEKNLENAERARKEAAGWVDSAKTQTNDDLKDAFNRAARNLMEAAADWDKAADARMRGQDEKAEELEKAAAEHEGAAKAFTEKDWAKGKAAEAAAKMHEKNAAGK